MATMVKAQKQDQDQSLLLPANLPGEIDKLRDDLRIERDRNLRTLADFKNYRRRIERDGNKVAEEAQRKIILPLLDIVDDMEKALEWANGEEQSVVKGVQIIHKKLLALLETHGILPFVSAGTAFNHELHEAVAIAEHEDCEPGTVVDELRCGYLWNNALLRPAQVRVAG